MLEALLTKSGSLCEYYNHRMSKSDGRMGFLHGWHKVRECIAVSRGQ